MLDVLPLKKVPKTRGKSMVNSLFKVLTELQNTEEYT